MNSELASLFYLQLITCHLNFVVKVNIVQNPLEWFVIRWQEELDGRNPNIVGLDSIQMDLLTSLGNDGPASGGGLVRNETGQWISRYARKYDLKPAL